MKANRISASSLDSYKWCPWRYSLTQEMRFYDESGASALMGNVAHTVLEILGRLSFLKHDKSSKLWNPKYLWDIAYNRHVIKAKVNNEGIDNSKLKKIAQGTLDLINSSYSPIRDNIISTEQRFNLPITEDGVTFNIAGFIDRMDKISDDTIEVIDYKTGTRTDFESKDRHKKNSKDLHKMLQPRMYHLAAKMLYPWASNILVTFIYLTDGGPISTPFCDSEVAITRNFLLNKHLQIANDNDPQRNLSWKCNSFCSFGKKSGICDKAWNDRNNIGYEATKNKYICLNYTKK